MSSTNPYQSTEGVSENLYGINKVRVRPIELIRRSHALIGDKYWLFLGITLVAMLVGSAVPLGLIFGAMLVGVYLCFIHREQGIKVELVTLFRGFDYFIESLLAWLAMFAISMLVTIPFMIAIFVVILAPILANANAANPPAGPPPFPMALLAIYPLMLIVSTLVTLPFIFVFQLLVDRNLKAIDAIKMSFRGVMKNFFGVLWFMIVMMFLSFVLAMMCYVPAILFMPLSFGAIFLLYRDIYGPGIQRSSPYDTLPKTAPPQG